ncbi:MAG: phytanoyl-CoA dioxygenase family protein, partial [Bacteroidota bacterium]
STKNQTETTNDYFLESGDKVRVFMEEGESSQSEQHRVNKLGHALHELDPVFSKFSQKKIWLMMAKELGMRSPKVLQSMYIFKQPQIGGEVNVHQDATFLYTDPISVVGFWFAIQDATKENGCLWALPGGHKLGLKSRFIREGYKTRMEILDESPLPEKGYVPIEVKAGTLVLLHGLLPHYSEANRSSNPRQAYALHLIDQAAEYLSDNWLQISNFSKKEKA